MSAFPTLGVVSSATGILVSDIGDVYDVLGYMLGDKLFTHQLPAGSRAAEGALKEQHPWLDDLVPPRDGGDLAAWCEDIEATHGRTISLTPIANPDWKPGNALADLAAMTDKPIIVVGADGGVE